MMASQDLDARTRGVIREIASHVEMHLGQGAQPLRTRVYGAFHGREGLIGIASALVPTESSGLDFAHLSDIIRLKSGAEKNRPMRMLTAHIIHEMLGMKHVTVVKGVCNPLSRKWFDGPGKLQFDGAKMGLRGNKFEIRRV